MTRSFDLSQGRSALATAAALCLLLLAGCERQSAAPVAATAASSAAASAALEAASAAATPAVAQPQLADLAGPFKFIGQVRGIKNGAVVHMEGKFPSSGKRSDAVIAKGVVKDGGFVLEGEVKDAPQLANLVVGDAIYEDFILEKGELKADRDANGEVWMVLLDFWASWCGPCREEFPHLRQVYAEHRKAGFEIFAISIDNQDDAWRKALKEENTPWVNTLDIDGVKAAEIYGGTGVPHSYLIAQDGTIVSKNDREWEIGRAVAKHIKAK